MNLPINCSGSCAFFTSRIGFFSGLLVLAHAERFRGLREDRAGQWMLPGGTCHTGWLEAEALRFARSPGHFLSPKSPEASGSRRSEEDWRWVACAISRWVRRERAAAPAAPAPPATRRWWVAGDRQCHARESLTVALLPTRAVGFEIPCGDGVLFKRLIRRQGRVL